MSSKRALVVDDSKSARAFLSRILERHEITVDAAESAEAAIDYLTRHKPDVIFMDHMMPGMDGFQAVQTIKNNPRTAAIPILMYTSQEGDLYLGQARALGAEGVLPKQIKQADVTKMLFQLRLVSDRRDGARDQTTFTRLGGADLLPANENAIVVPVQPSDSGAPAPAPTTADSAPEVAKLLPQLTLDIRAAIDASLRRELAQLRGHLDARLDGHTERLHGDIATLLPPPRSPDLDVPTVIAERRPWGAITGWSLAIVAVGCTAAMSWLWWTQGGEMAALRTDLAAAYAEAETLRARPEVVSVPAAVTESFVPEGAAPGDAFAAAVSADAVAPPAPLAPVDASAVPVAVPTPSPVAAPVVAPVAAPLAAPAQPAATVPAETATAAQAAATQ
jgi:CheY-like chemotaxis protein